MTLIQLNESYDEYMLTEAYYLEEGLKYFRKSKKLSKLAKKITIKAAKNPELEKGAVSLTKLASGYKDIEDKFISKKINRKTAKGEIVALKALHSDAQKEIKKAAFVKAAKIAGIAVSVAGAGVLMNHLMPQLFTGLASNIAGIFGKTKAGIAAAVEATGLKPEILTNAPEVPVSASGIDSASMADGAMADKFRTPKVADAVKPTPVTDSVKTTTTTTGTPSTGRVRRTVTSGTMNASQRAAAAAKRRADQLARARG